MEIHGFNKTTLLDYPEHIAATVFTGGCNFRCPFCHNGELVLDPGCQPSVPEEEVLAYLKKRQGILQGVCTQDLYRLISLHTHMQETQAIWV